MTAPQEHSPRPRIILPPSRLGWIGLGIIALGLFFRAILFITGRVPVDGDEYIMGVMGYHMSQLEHFPIYFYRQHYMGTIEVPPVALLMALGSDDWKFSIWPIRIVELGYFIAFLLVHFHLVARFFGRSVAIWSLFFVCVGQMYWMDYTLRLRHVILMMTFGELMAVLALNIIDQWERERIVRPSLLLLLGLVAGVGWWHYQLIAFYFISLTFIVLCLSSYVLDWLRKASPGSADSWPATLFRLAMLSVSLGALASLSLGIASRKLWAIHETIFYPQLIAIILILFALASALYLHGYRRDRRASTAIDPKSSRAVALQRLAPLLLGIGFIVGYAPAWIYLIRLKEEFWVSHVDLVLYDFWGRLRNFLILEACAMLEITRPISPGSNEFVMSIRSYIYLILYGTGLYLLVRKCIRPAYRSERVGATYFLTLLVVVILLHVATPRQTAIISPRFFVPAFSVTSVMLALMASEVLEAVRISIGRAWIFSAATSLVIAFVAFYLWIPIWLEAREQDLDWPSGHRKIAVELVRAMLDHNVQRVAPVQGISSVLLGYELQFVARLKIRFYRTTMGDRLEGIVDENQYGGDEYYLGVPGEERNWRAEVQRLVPDRMAEFEARSFKVGEYELAPLPEGFNRKGGVVTIEEWTEFRSSKQRKY